MDKIGVFGGTFNPPHLGHLRLARAFDRLLDFDAIIVVPAFSPPHKTAPSLASGEDRLAMCRLLFSGLPKAEVSDTELRRGGRSYTYDTLVALGGRFPGARLYLIVGSDMLNSFRQWHRYGDILALCTLCAARRRGDDELDGSVEGVITADFEPLDISSTELRALAASGAELSPFAGADVANYINQKGLYRG